MPCPRKSRISVLLLLRVVPEWLLQCLLDFLQLLEVAESYEDIEEWLIDLSIPFIGVPSM